MKEKRVEVNVKELTTLIKNGQKLQSSVRQGKVYLEFSGRGPTPLWMNDLAKMRGVEDQANRRLRNRLGKTRILPSRTKDSHAAA